MTAALILSGVSLAAGYFIGRVEGDWKQRAAEYARREKVLALKGRLDEAALPGPWTAADGR